MDRKEVMYPYTIGVAGHIDHGKTTLTKKLTGVDTDRLKEEKERGISIELGFAPLVLPNGAVIGVVDVPGHERFIRQMIAGSVGIDLVLLVIAADEGIMPQTREHVDILRFLGIGKGVIALTKIDTVDKEWLEMVREEVAEWAQDSFLAEAPVVAVSARTGEGIERLRSTIEQQLSAVEPRKYDAPARLPIDRVFKIKGAGTVVTGTLYEGTISEGDILELLPGGAKTRVRRLHVHGKQVDKAFAGQRVAVNITGENTDYVYRGMALITPKAFRESQRIDIRLSMLKNAPGSIKQRSSVRLHIGTSEVIGKIVFFDRNVLEPGEEAFCQLQLEEPIIAKKGEPFVLRRLSPMTTIGGGQVIDSYADRHRFGIETVQRLARKAEGSMTEQLMQFLDQAEFATASEILHHFAISHKELRTLLQDAIKEVMAIGRELQADKESGFFLILHSTLEKWMQVIINQLAAYHQRYPLRIGMDKALLKSTYFKRVPDRLWREIVEQVKQRGHLQEENNFLYLTGFSPSFPNNQAETIKKALSELLLSGFTPPSWSALMKKHAISEELSGDIKAFLLYREEIVYLEEDLYIDRREWSKGVEKLRGECGPGEIFTPAHAKDILGLSRKYLIPFLESLDRQNLTKRVEEGRVWQLTT
ncbi:selenocysteine-specific translation elongation factor [Brevibacillus sp. WF146]|uniref:selenocysteine-specific translation elongation factor n=1 Tax=Brevibacillus sp. WF146 TaxID=319501 RepID=UPI0007FF4A62|nr:selenocysteine-specific translation elongation factor [Brevibacillus sp. WF146]UYZ12616.1 selenocysteine-specific translation elongation factor [Brevibacillus sp. WF146]